MSYENYINQSGRQYPPQNGGGYMGGGQYQQPHHMGGGYGQPSAMGFHSQGGHMGSQHGGFQPRRDGEQEDILTFFRTVAYGERPCPEELKQIILGVVGEQANGMLAQYGYSQNAGYDDHRRYKEALEDLRDIPNVTEAVKKAGQMFEGLTDEDRKVLQQILNRPSYRKMASMVNMPLDRFMSVKHGLEQKLKQQ